MFWLKRILLSSSISKSPFDCYLAESRMWLRHFADQSPQFEQMEHPKYSCFICYCCGCLVPSIWGFCLMMMLLYARGGNTCGTLALHTAYSRVNHEAECWVKLARHLRTLLSVSLGKKQQKRLCLVSLDCQNVSFSFRLFVRHSHCLWYCMWDMLPIWALLCVYFSYNGPGSHCRRRSNSAATLTNAHIN